MTVESSIVLYFLNMLIVLFVCAFTRREQRYVHIIIGALLVLVSTLVHHFILYVCHILMNLLAIRASKHSTYPLLFVNLCAVILVKIYSDTLGIDILCKNNITIRLILLVPQIFYLSRAHAGFQESFEYIFFLPSILAGPVIPYEQYKRREKKLVEEEKSMAHKKEDDSVYVVQKLLEVVLFACLMMLVKKAVPFEFVVYKKSLLLQVFLLYTYGLGFRSQYYLIWAFSSVCYRLCGHNIVNISFFKVEAAQSIKDVSKHWNTYTGIFLRKSIFDPLKSKSVFMASIATFVVSSLLHGGHPCYFMMFISLGLSILALRNSKKLVDTYLWALPAKIVNAVIVSLFISYVSVPFYFIDVRKTLSVWTSVRWYGHLMVLLLYAVCFAVQIQRRTEKAK